MGGCGSLQIAGLSMAAWLAAACAGQPDEAFSDNLETEMRLTLAKAQRWRPDAELVGIFGAEVKGPFWAESKSHPASEMVEPRERSR